MSTFFSCCKGEKNPFVLFSCLDVTFYTASLLFFLIQFWRLWLSHTSISISHKHSCGRLLAHWGLPAWASSSSSSLLRASPLQSHSPLRRILSGFSGLMLIAWELVLFHSRINSMLFAFHSLWPKPCCPGVSLHSCTIRPFPSFEPLECERTFQVQ